MASIREIAQKANVAPGTVSRALNNKGYISKETREKIEKAMVEIEYAPNELARNLYRNRNNMIGVILPDIEHPFFIGVIKKLVIEMKRYHYGVVLWTTEYDPGEEEKYLERLKCNVVDGVVIMVPALEKQIYQNTKRPIVLMDRTIEGMIDIEINQEKSGRLAAEKLYQDGCRNVLTVVGEESEEIPSLKRHKAFSEEMEKLGGRVTVLKEEWNNFELEYHMRRAEEILDHYPNADGIYAADILGTAFLKTLLKRGRKVPEEFEIISTDGVYESGNRVINLSAIVQPAEKIAKSIAENIIAQIEGKRAKKPECIDVYLFNGDTTK